MKTQANRKWIVLVLVLLNALSWTDLRADESNAPPESAMMKFMTQDYLLGNWGGGRTWLSEHGVDFEFFYIGTMPWVVSGGKEKSGAVYQGLLAMTMDLDSRKLAGYDGGHFHVGGLQLHGEKPFSDAFIGDLNKVNLIDYPNGSRLWELWYEQRFVGTNVGVKAGLLAVDQDFITPDVSSRIFVNQTFFFPTIAFNLFDYLPGVTPGFHGLPASPLSAPGVRVRVDPSDKFFAQAAVYDGYPDMSKTGTRININSAEGALTWFETGYRWQQGANDPGLPGNVKVGGYYHTDDFYDNYNTILFLVGARPSPTTHSGNYGAYATVDQVLYREGDANDPAKQGLGAFARGGWAPKDRNLVGWALDGGLVYRGLIPTRDWDVFGVTAAWMWMSEDIVSVQRFVNSGAPGTFAVADYEGLMEVTYKAQLTAWWTLQPSLQKVMHPGGSELNRNAWAFILMTTVRF